MTEAEWFGFSETDDLCLAISRVGGERSRRLFVAACLHDCSKLLPAEGAVLADLNEQIADGRAPASRLVRLRRQQSQRRQEGLYAGQVLHAAVNPVAVWAATGTTWHAWSLAASTAATRWLSQTQWHEEYTQARDAAKARHFNLFRCIHGNPFRPVTFAPAWLTPTVVGLAAAIYEERAFDRLPILADALQDAGCEDEQVLGHCRGDGPHVRGCWVVDGVLGKG